MKISKDKDNLIIKIPLMQRGEHTYGEGKWCIQNFVLVKTWDKMLDDWDYTISQGNYLDYKDDLQEGMPIVHLTEKEFNEVLKITGFSYGEHQKCHKCGGPIYGCYTCDKDGHDICMTCGK
jgi:hypothetical protein